ncbi:MAG: glycosyl transferase [Bacteroidales bacterium]|nr:glycosyl transferase [Bacteroidales bacterium]
MYVYAFDDECYQKLMKLRLPKMSVISLKELETKELLDVKPTRNRAEYCWTCGPSAIYHTIRNFNLEHCTYIDADLMFFNSPKIAFDTIESVNASIAITEHFTPKEDPAGKYCVQFVYFKNDKDGMAALKWWKDSCIEWCYARYENGRYGDQKYLDMFPSKFRNVYIFEDRGIGVAPWNMNQYRFQNNYQFMFNEKSYSIVFFHFHGTSISLENKKLILRTVTYDLSVSIKNIIFDAFMKRYKNVCKTYLCVDIDGYIVKRRKIYERLYSKIKSIFKNINFIRNIFYFLSNKRYNGYEKDII